MFLLLSGASDSGGLLQDLTDLLSLPQTLHVGGHLLTCVFILHQGLCFEGVLSAAFSESDRFVFTGSQDRTVKVWDVASGKDPDR